MPRAHDRRRLFLFAAVVVASIGYAGAAAATRPFTWGADVLTAIPIAIVAVLAVAWWPARPDHGTVLQGDERTRRRHPYLAWLVLLAAVAGWELAEYLRAGSRSAHPTLSSMADAFDAHAVGRAAAFVLWLALGAAIVALGAPIRSNAGTAASRRRQPA